MKNRICSTLAVFVILINLFSVKIYAFSDKDNNFSITINSGYTVLTAENLGNNEDVLKKLNFTQKGFKDYLKTNNIAVYAVNTENGSEVVLRVVNTDFAKNVGDLSLLDDSSIDRIAPKIVNKSDYSVEKINSTKFLKTIFEAQDKGGNFYGTQYFTVKNGQVYILSLSFPSSVNKQSAIDIESGILENFVIRKNSAFSWQNFGDIITFVIVFLAIILFAVVAGYIIYTFVTDIKNKNSSNDVAPYVKIKRRKF